VLVPYVELPHADYADLYRRCRERWATPRIEVERQIVARQEGFNAAPGEEAFRDWQ
jgi:hypothetical protein